MAHSDHHSNQLSPVERNLIEEFGTTYESWGLRRLYATTEPTLDDELARFEVRGHQMRICTVDLNQKWSCIHEDLLALVDAN
jgi:hypothetical protein